VSQLGISQLSASTMSTRAAAKREATSLQEALAATLSSPPSTPTDTETPIVQIVVANQSTIPQVLIGAGVVISDNQSQVNLPTPLASAKRKRAPTKERKTTQSIKIELDVLPHGLGRKGDLLDDTSIGNRTSSKIPTPLPQKRKLRGKAAQEDDDTTIFNSKIAIKSEDKTNANGPSKATPASSSKVDPVTVELLEEALPKKRGRKANTAKFEEGGVESEDEDFEEPPKKKPAPRKKILDVSEDVLDKVNDMVNASGQLPKNKEKKKANKYGLTPGKSPFPEHVKPTAEDCEEVNHLLSKLHGEVKPPDVIPPPSMEVTGCGEVPDLLDAILRTLLSASTTANNANLSLQGLKDKFHLRESGIGKGSINWEAVHRADLDEVIVAIKSGGLAKIKGTNIKKILDVVYEQNCARRDAFLEEKQTGKAADIPGAKNLTKNQKDIEIAKANDNMLSMDHLFEMTTDEAMEEMTKLPGIGVKTASCVILFCMKRPSFAVDTHVWRHCKWLGWVPEKATRDQTFSHCEIRVPDHLKYSLHQLFLKHGKTCGRCRANTSAGTEDWDNTECPIDHLVNRTEEKKMPGSSGVTKSKSGKKPKGDKKGKKGKKQDDETEESDTALHDEAGQSGSEYGG
jgi:endonuclease III